MKILNATATNRVRTDSLLSAIAREYDVTYDPMWRTLRNVCDKFFLPRQSVRFDLQPFYTALVAELTATAFADIFDQSGVRDKRLAVRSAQSYMRTVFEVAEILQAEATDRQTADGLSATERAQSAAERNLAAAEAKIADAERRADRHELELAD